MGIQYQNHGESLEHQRKAMENHETIYTLKRSTKHNIYTQILIFTLSISRHSI